MSQSYMDLHLPSTRLNVIDALHTAAVLEDTVDQLIILGRVMPGTFRQAAALDALPQVDSLKDLTNSPKRLDASASLSSMRRRSLQKSSLINRSSDVISVPFPPANQRQSSQTRLIRDGPIMDNVEKLQADRAFVEQVLYSTAREITESGTYESLTDAIAKEKEMRRQLEEIIIKEAEEARRTKMLQRRIAAVHAEHGQEVQKRDEMIAHLKDQLQEAKAKAGMEGKYVSKVSGVGVEQTRKRCGAEENKLKNEVAELKTQIDEENRVNAEIESFLRAHIEQRQELLSQWLEKYDTEVEDKQKDLEILKAAKAADYARLIDLTRLYHEYEQVVVDDRVEKEKLRRKQEKEAEQQAAAVRIQAWWRGLMVTRCLGPFKPKKKKKKGGKKAKGKK